MTSRCRPGHDKVIYKSKRMADRAIQAMRNGRVAATDDLIAYRCQHRAGHWHVGNLGAGPSDPPDTSRPRFTPQEWDQATMLLWARCRDRCEWCDKPLGNDLARHHRQRRQIGGDRLSNLVALHTACHRHVHAHPEQARAVGFIVSSYDPDPAEYPITTTDGRQFFLDDEGGRHPA